MARANPQEPADLPFLLTRSVPTPPSRILGDALASIAVHILIAVVLISIPAVERPTRAPLIIADIRKSVTLVAPRFTDLTQKDPNIGKVSHSLDVRSAESAPMPRAPRVVPAISFPTAPPTPAPVPAPVVVPVVVEVPRIETPAPAPLPVGNGTSATQLPPPAPDKSPDKPNDKPKLTFESVTAAAIRAQNNNASIKPPPKNTVEEIARAATRPSGGGGITVGDEIDPIPNPGAIGQLPAPGRMGSNLQLLSDPTGVDFKPYLVQVLAAVRRNWMAVVPESARLGRRGQVLLQFIIDRDGKVPKLVIASPSGTDAFDRAAVAGVSMSHPFPPLPATYKGDEIRLQLAFSYNIPR